MEGTENLVVPQSVDERTSFAPQRRSKLVVVIVLLVVLAVAVVVGGLAINAHSRSEARKKSQTQGRAAAATYVTAEHEYLTAKAKELTYAAALSTTSDDADATLAKITKERQHQPALGKVDSTGAKVAQYVSAKAYSDEIAKFDKALGTLQATNDAFMTDMAVYDSLYEAYKHVDDTHSAILNEMAAAKDLIAFFTDKLINPLTDSKAKLAKANIPSADKYIADLINKASDVYIQDGTELRTSYQTGKVDTKQYGYPDLQPIVKALDSLKSGLDQAVNKLNDQANALAAQATQLAKPS